MARAGQRRGWLRRLARWGTVALCAVILLLYAASFRWWSTLAWRSPAGDDWRVTLDHGWIAAHRTDVLLPMAASVSDFPDEEPAFRWGRSSSGRVAAAKRFEWNGGTPSLPGGKALFSWYTLPAWPLALAAGTGSLGLTLPPVVRRRARRRRGACAACGYSRAGLNNESPCPECGAPPGGADAPAP